MVAKTPVKKPKKTLARQQTSLIRRMLTRAVGWWHKNWWNKLVAIVVALAMLMVGGMYSIAQWYIWSNRNKPLQMGVTFIPSYARSFGLDPKETMQAIIDDLGVKHFRLVSYWEVIEPVPGTYDFSELDWQFEKANAAGAKVSLSIGLRQPRWPECHMPDWAKAQSMEQWYPPLKDVMQAVIERYKTNPALQDYQLENEFFLKVFGECPDFTRERLVEEFNLVKSIDPNHPVTVSRSNNWVGVPINEPVPDAYAVSVYKRVWDHLLTKRYMEYPYPAWYYAFYAGASKILQGKDMYVHELQAESWPPLGQDIRTTSTEELYNSLSPDRLRQRFRYGEATGMKQIDLWGVEWWYAMKVNRNDPALWNVAQEEFQRAQELNAKLH